MKDKAPEVAEFTELAAVETPLILEESIKVPKKAKKASKKDAKRKLKKKYVFTDDSNCVDDVLDFGYDVFIGWWRD
jgi:hypothetical protein